jgi:glucose/arabinose dehydrogenase
MSGGMPVRMRIALIAGCLLSVLATAARADAIGLEPVGTFDAPVYATSPPGDPRLFVVERGGTIQALHDGTSTQFLNISGLTTNDGERGLLSMAFDPHYATNGLFYVFYTGVAAADGVTGLGHVDEFHVSSDPNVADQGSQRHVLTISRPSAGASNHNGGQLQFGKDGLLYVSVGDGGTGGSTAPSTSFPNGKILRIDPHGSGNGAHGIPSGNPYSGVPGAVQEIWSLGLRNPFRFSFDALTGDLLIADVGETQWEEVDFAPAATGGGRGANFGWPGCEGVVGSCPGTTAPVFVYPHSDPGGDVADGCAIIGGFVYRGSLAPEISGRYLYADLCTAELRSLDLTNPPATDRPESAPGALESARSFGEDSGCNLYAMNGSTVFRIVGSGGAGASVCQTAPSTCGKCPPGKKGKKCRHKRKKRAAESKKHKKHKKKKCKHHKKKHKKK